MEHLDETEMLLENLINEKRGLETLREEIQKIKYEIMELEKFVYLSDAYFDTFQSDTTRGIIDAACVEAEDTLKTFYEVSKVKEKEYKIKIREFERDFGVIY